MPTGSRASGLAQRPRRHVCGTSGPHAEPQAVNVLLHTSADWADFDEIAKAGSKTTNSRTRRSGHRWSSGRAVGRPRVGRDRRTTTREMGGVLSGRHCGCARHPKLLGAEFVILAQALASGRDLADISVMQIIAARTVAFFERTSIED